MSTLGSVMNNALKSMTANQLALSVASNNIANAQTPGYTRQRLISVPAGPGGDSFGIGTGVDVLGVEVMRDALIETRLRQETSAKSGDDTLTKTLGDVEVLFNNTENTGLLLALTNFFNSFHTLSLDPASMNFREEVKANAQALIDSFHAKNDDLANIKNLANNAIAGDVVEINRLTTQIASVSKEIKLQEIQSAANDLRDRRAALVKQLSEIVEVHELESDGAYQLSTKSNRLLVFDNKVQSMAVTDVTSDIGNGSLKAHLDVRDVYIPKYTTALDQLAYELADEVNSIHSAAYNLDGDTGVDFFTPLASASGAARLIALSSDVSSDVRKIAASELSTGNDNQAAMELGNLLHASVFSAGSITDQYRNIVFDVGTDMANAQVSLREHDALVSQLENRRQSLSGVSIDEETSQILQFQRAYEASGRLVRAVDELLQFVLAIGA